MAIRNVRTMGDPILTKKAKEVKEITGRTKSLIEDMLETMYEYDGVGLAAPQVGILKRIVVIDIGEGPLVFVNPVITMTDGEQCGSEARSWRTSKMQKMLKMPINLRQHQIL